MFNRTWHAIAAIILGLSLGTAGAQTFTEPPLLDNCNRTEDPLVGTAAQCASPPCWSQKINSAWPSDILANGSTCQREVPGVAGDAGAVWWNVSTLGPDMAIAATYPDATPSTTGLHYTLYVRVQNPGTATYSAYGCRYEISAGLHFIEVNSGSAAGLGSPCAVTVNDGDQLACEIIGSSLRLYRNTGSGWTLACGPISDSSITGVGFVGLGAGTSTVSFDTIRGGTISATAVSQGAIMPLLQ